MSLKPLQPLIIAGMHRSGTSLTAAFFQALGISMGAQLYRADVHNPKGYFEDLDFLEFQRGVLQACCDRTLPGWPDWGWTEPESLAVERFDQYLDQAQDLIAARPHDSHWGWKDPRTTLMLDFWHNLLPDARFLLVYRYPWDVVDSILRLQAPIFEAYPQYSLEIWQFYNRKLLDFYNRYPRQCLLVSVNELLHQPQGFLELCAAKLNLDLPLASAPEALAQVYDPQIFGTLPWEHALVTGMTRACPEAIALLEALDQAADLGNQGRPKDHPAAIALLKQHQAALKSAPPSPQDPGILKNITYDQQTIAVFQAVLSLDANCVDVGCHRGDVLSEILKYAPQGHHFAFEPLPEFYQILVEGFANFARVSLFNYALSDTVRQTEFLHVVSNPGYSGFQKRDYAGEEQIVPIQVQTNLLDRCIPPQTKIDLIKIDVEGAELEVLRGGIATIKRCQPVIIFEHGMGAANHYGTKPEMIFELLVGECGLQISTMARFLTHQPCLTEQEFYRHFCQGLDFYFMAYKYSYKEILAQKNHAIEQLQTELATWQFRAAQQQAQIVAMESSKFWKMRQAWFKFKQIWSKKN